MALRPILKTSTDSSSSSDTTNALPFATCSRYQVLYSPHVHFPPTPTLTSIEITHSPSVYDRAPIVVAPNNCALPERGGRAYKPYGGANTTSYVSAKILETWEREYGQQPSQSPDAPDAFMFSSSRPGSTDFSGSTGYMHPQPRHYHPQFHSTTSTPTCPPTCASTHMNYSPSPSPLSHCSDEVSFGADGSAIPHSSITTTATTYNHYYMQSHTQPSLQQSVAPPIPPSRQSSYSSLSEGYADYGSISSPPPISAPSSSSLLSTSPPKEKSKRRKSFDRPIGFGSSTLDGCLGGF